MKELWRMLSCVRRGADDDAITEREKMELRLCGGSEQPGAETPYFRRDVPSRA
jgi:hypothetical protein